MFRLLHNPSLRKRMPPKSEREQKMKDHLLMLIMAKNTSTQAYSDAMDYVYLNADYYTERILTMGTYYEKNNINFTIALQYYITTLDHLEPDRDIPLIKLASTVLPHINPKEAYWGPGCMKVIRDDDWVEKWQNGPRKKKKSIRDPIKKPRLIYDMNINRWI